MWNEQNRSSNNKIVNFHNYARKWHLYISTQSIHILPPSKNLKRAKTKNKNRKQKGYRLYTKMKSEDAVGRDLRSMATFCL